MCFTTCLYSHSNAWSSANRLSALRTSLQFANWVFFCKIRKATISALQLRPETLTVIAMTTLQGDILWSDTQHVDKKTIIGAKVTISGKGRILEHCISLTCTVSDYFKTLIEKDMARAAEGNIMRIRVEGDKIMLTCIHCGGPVPFSLADLGLTRA